MTLALVKAKMRGRVSGPDFIRAGGTGLLATAPGTQDWSIGHQGANIDIDAKCSVKWEI